MSKEEERQKQLSCKANFINKDGLLYLRRCLICPGFEDIGRENYALNVCHGICAWCGWSDKGTERIFKEQKYDPFTSHNDSIVDQTYKIS